LRVGSLIGPYSLSHPVGAKATADALPDKDRQALPRVTPAYAS